MPPLLLAAVLIALTALPGGPEAATTSAGSTDTTSATTTPLPGTRIRCYVCDPCSLGGGVSLANAMNETVCEQCGKSVVGYLGTVTRISRQCFRREDSARSQCVPSSNTDSMQVCCSDSNFCNPAGRAQVAPLLLQIGVLLLLLLQLSKNC